MSETKILQANATFTTNLYQILSRRKGNILFSPLSIHAVLSMLYQGAKGETVLALSNVLRNPDPKLTAEGYKIVISYLNSLKDITLISANKIYGNRGKKKFSKDFENVITKNFGSEVELLSMDDPKKAAKIVNEWVEKKTLTKIKNIVNETNFNKNLSLILINGTYFNGEWLSKFKEKETKKDKFHLDNKTTVEVNMMHQKEYFFYKNDKELDAEVLEMPYKGSAVKMVIILPKQNIENLENKLANIDLRKVTDGVKGTDIHLYLPKFRMDVTLQLNDPLMELGLNNIFNVNTANFKGIMDSDSPQDNVYVSEVLQKAFIEVNEGGTVAAAATKVEMVAMCALGGPKPVVFRVDRPAIFLLVVSHGDEENVLFFGRISQPQY